MTVGLGITVTALGLQLRALQRGSNFPSLTPNYSCIGLQKANEALAAHDCLYSTARSIDDLQEHAWESNSGMRIALDRADLPP